VDAFLHNIANERQQHACLDGHDAESDGAVVADANDVVPPVLRLVSKPPVRRYTRGDKSAACSLLSLVWWRAALDKCWNGVDAGGIYRASTEYRDICVLYLARTEATCLDPVRQNKDVRVRGY